MASTLFEEDVVSRYHRGRLQLGLVVRNHDWYSSVDESEDEEERIRKGHVRVAWYPRGRENVLPEKKVTLSDRSVMPGDAVRRNQEGSQRGIVRSVHVSCHLQVVRTKQMIYNVCSQGLHNIMMYTPSCHVVMGSWIGIVRSIYVQLVVRLKNGARCTLSDDSACRLTDIHDTNEEDSVFSCDSFYPGQILRGPASIFKNATWLSGQQPILSTKANFTVTVEEVNVVELDVHWQTRGLCRYSVGDFTDSNQLQPPPRKVTETMLPRVRPLSYFIAASVQIGDKVMYRLKPGDLAHPRPVTRGSLECFLEPGKGDGGGEGVAGMSASPPETPPPKSATSKEGEVVSSETKPRSTEGEDGAASEQKLAEEPPSLKCGPDGAPRPAESAPLTPEDEATGSSASPEGSKQPSCIAAESGDGEPRNPVPGGGASGVASVTSGIRKVQSCDPTTTTPTPPPSPGGEDKQDLLARAEVLKVGLSRDVDLLGELHRELCDASESVSDIAKNFRTLLQRATDASAREIGGQVSRLLESQGKLRQQILMTEGLLVDSKKSLRELDDIETETRGGGGGGAGGPGRPPPPPPPPVAKAARKPRCQAAAKRSGRRRMDDRDSDPSSEDYDDYDDDSSSDGADTDDTDSNASSKGESRRHKVVSSLLHRHTKKQHMRLASKRRPPPKPLEADEMLCVEVTHTTTLVDVMWQDGTLQKDVISTDLFPVHQLDDLEFFPGDFVTKNNEDLENVYGLVCRTDHKERTCLVQWIVRPNQQCSVPRPANSEEVSVYELTPHPDFTFNVGDVIVRIADSLHGIASVKKPKADAKAVAAQFGIAQTGDSTRTPMGDGGARRGQEETPQPDAPRTPGEAAAASHNSVDVALEDTGAQLCGPDVEKDLNHGPPTNSQAADLPDSSSILSDLSDSAVEATKRSDPEQPACVGRNNHRLEERPRVAREPALGGGVDAAGRSPARPELLQTQDPPGSEPPPSASTDGRIADQQQQQQGTRRSPEARRSNVDRMNRANLQAGQARAPGDGGSLLRPDAPMTIAGAALTPEEPVPCAGQVRWINTSGEIHVAWVDGSESDVLPQDLYKLEEDSDSDWSENEHNEEAWKGGDYLDTEEYSSSSWETASDASRSAEDANIISPPAAASQDERPRSPTSSARPPGKDSGSLGDKTPPPHPPRALPPGLQGATYEQTFSALSLVEDKMRRINSCANSILEKQTGLSLLVQGSGPDAAATAAAIPEDGRKPGDATAEDGTGSAGSAPTSHPRSSLQTGPASPDASVDDDGDAAGRDVVHGAPSSPKEEVADASDTGEGARRKDSKSGGPDLAPESPMEPHATSWQSDDNFVLMDEAPKSHLFINFLPEEPKQLALTMRREMRLLQTSLPPGIKVKAFADRLDLFSVLFEGPSNTPYEDGLFFFDARLPHDYPKSPPIMHYHAYCSGQLNPNLYNDGKVCVSLLGTWAGKGSEVWTSKSNLLQVLVSIQGLILVSEPYYNEAGYEKHRGSQPGKENSRLYNEMAVLKMVQSMTMMLTNPPAVFDEETTTFCSDHGFKMVHRIEKWLSNVGREPGTVNQDACGQPCFPLLPLSKGFILSTKQALRAYRSALNVAGVPDS